MSPLQIFFIVLTFAGPVTLWAWRRRAGLEERFDLVVCRMLAGALVAAEVLELFTKLTLEHQRAGLALPMQLCDWALLAAAGALWFRSRLCFEVTYFWGLAGTLQALFTPAIASDLAQWRVAAFFFIHSGIVMSVLYLMLALKQRPLPASAFRAVAVAMLYQAVAIPINALAGANYGFLAHKPAQASLLSLFSDTWWLYVLQINVTGWVFFTVLYLPWFIRDLARGRAMPR